MCEDNTKDKKSLWGGKGKRTYNNGVVAKRYFEGEQPDGFVLGMLPRTNEQKAGSNAKRIKTTLEKYGVSNVAQSKDVYDKIVETNLKKYGVKHPQTLESQKEKVKKTNLERYGTTNGKILKPKVDKPKKEKKVKVSRTGGVGKVSLRGRGTFYNNGVINRKFIDGDAIPDGFVKGKLMSDEEKLRQLSKRKETLLARYGVDNVAKSREIYEKVKKTNLERYGVEYSAQADVVKEKIKTTNLKKYGVECSFQAEVVKGKIKATNLERYGVDNPSKSTIIKSKIVESNRKNLGVDYPMQSKEVMDKSRVTSLEKYGTEYPNQSDIVKQHIKESNLEKYGVERPAQSDEIKRKTIETNRKRYGVDYTCLVFSGKYKGNDSSYNRSFAKLLDDVGIVYEREFLLEKYSYDFKVGNTLIEINPTATHNTHFNPYGKNRIDVNYHRDKSKLAKDSGYHVIHVFDWDDTDKVVQLLKDRVTVYARNCDIRVVSGVDTNNYLDMYHLQSTCRGQKIRLGLYYNNQLVSLMTFGKSRFNKNCEYELLRYCASHNVVGGSEKLFKYFVDNYKPNSIVSYCDTSKFSGKVYDALGFTLDTINSPSCHWYSVKENKHITDNLLHMQGYDRLFKENHGKGTSNEELILNRGYLPVYDCGQATYVWYSHKNIE
jgi:possible homing endonuclease|nr:MAG TPA: endonuclease-like protein [Caudoviricetes sp.]